MKKVNVVVYEFNELSKEVQDKVIQRYREELAGVLDDNVNYIMQQEFNNYTDNLDFSLAYSLYSCQGDSSSLWKL